MAMRAACDSPSWIAGIGVVAASMSTEIASICTQNKPKPLTAVMVFGDKDSSFLSNLKQVNPVKPSQQRGTHIGIKESLSVWQKINQCTKNTATQTLDQLPRDNTTVIKQSYTHCTKPVVFYDIKNGGHRWPVPDARNGRFMVKMLNLGLASREINAAEEILNILLNP